MNRVSFFIVAMLVFLGCKREGNTWDIDVIGPVAQAELMLEDILPDSNLSTNDNDLFVLTINSDLLGLKPDTLASIPDTTVSNAYSIPFTAFPLAPGTPFTSDDGSIEVNPGNGISIKEASICEGLIIVEMINPLETTIIIDFTINGLSLDGIPFSISDSLLPGTNSNPTIKFLEFDMRDYEMNLTGESGFSSNELTQSLTVSNSDSGDLITISNLDTVRFNLAIENMFLTYVKGYLGSMEITEQGNFVLENMLNLSPGNILVEQVSLDLNISNGIGVDFRILESEYLANNVDNELTLLIENDDLNDNININRAIDLGSAPQYTNKVLHLDETNSNLVDIISLAPDSFNIMLTLEVNPLGNSSSFNDFVYKEHGVKLDADLNIPLSLAISDLILNDTLKFDIDEDLFGKYEAGTLTLYADNSFPLDIELNLSIDSEETIIPLAENLDILSCSDPANDCLNNQSVLNIELTKDQVNLLLETGVMLISGQFSTDGIVHFRPNQKLSLKAVLDGKVNIGF
ncbi:MAG: hypothetical protein ACI8XB_000790 [Patiriisocius sp.]|jgi:hypothetical protein